MSSSTMKQVKRLVENEVIQLTEEDDGFHVKWSVGHNEKFNNSLFGLWLNVLSGREHTKTEKGTDFHAMIEEHWLNEDRIQALRGLINDT
jgi:hypothetical protein